LLAVGAGEFEAVGYRANISTQLPLFGVSCNKRLETASYSSDYTAYSCGERECGNRVIKPVLIVFWGIIALLTGFWLMYFRRTGWRAWTLGAVLFLIGWLACVVGGTWLCILHVMPSFAQASVHADHVSAPTCDDATNITWF
jgi:hypothetical protein